MAQQEYLTSAPSFWGKQGASHRAGDTAEDFIQRIEDIRKSANPPMTDRQSIATAAKYFRGEASQWWNTTIPLSEEPDDLINLQTNWDAFCRLFRSKYFRVGGAHTALVDWQSLRQLPHEEAYVFLERLAAQIHEATHVWVQEKKDVIAEQIPHLQLDVVRHPALAPLINFLENPANAETAAALTTAAAEFKAEVTHSAIQRFNRSHNVHLTAKQAGHALSDSRLRTAIRGKSQQDVTYKELLTFLRQQEAALGTTPTQQRAMAPKGTTAAAAAADPKEDSAQVNAQKASGKTGNGAKPKRPWCTFCRRKGHVVTECRTKQRAQASVHAAEAEAFAAMEPSSGNE